MHVSVSMKTEELKSDAGFLRSTRREKHLNSQPNVDYRI